MKDSNQPPTTPETTKGDQLERLLFYMKRYESGIFIREQNKEGKWVAIALKDLTPEQWSKCVARFLRLGIEPCRILEPDEIQPVTFMTPNINPQDIPTPRWDKLDADLGHDIQEMQKQGARLTDMTEHYLFNLRKDYRALERELILLQQQYEEAKREIAELEHENNKLELEISTMITHDAMMSKLKVFVEHFGSQKAAAFRLGVSEAYLSDVLKKKRHIGNKIANRFGYKSVHGFMPLNIV